jgi:hypothetical protein
LRENMISTQRQGEREAKSNDFFHDAPSEHVTANYELTLREGLSNCFFRTTICFYEPQLNLACLGQVPDPLGWGEEMNYRRDFGARCPRAGALGLSDISWVRKQVPIR